MIARCPQCGEPFDVEPVLDRAVIEPSFVHFEFITENIKHKCKPEEAEPDDGLTFRERWEALQQAKEPKDE